MEIKFNTEFSIGDTVFTIDKTYHGGCTLCSGKGYLCDEEDSWEESKYDCPKCLGKGLKILNYEVIEGVITGIRITHNEGTAIWNKNRITDIDYYFSHIYGEDSSEYTKDMYKTKEEAEKERDRRVAESGIQRRR